MFSFNASSRVVSRRLLQLSLSLSFCVLAACQTVTEPNPPSPSTNPLTQSSASPTPAKQIEGQPPVIPVFPSQGVIPEGRQGGVRGGLMDKSAGLEAPVMSAPASAADSFGGGDASEGSSAGRAPSKPTAVSDTSMPRPFPSPPTEPQVQPEAGLLTAGEWNDNTHWDFWLGLAQNQEWSQSMGLWGMNTQQRIAVKLTGPSGPLSDTPVVLRDAQTQKVLFQARTDNQGMAYVFKNWADQSKVAIQNEPVTTSNDLEILVNQGQNTLTHVLKSGETSVSLTSEVAQEPAVNADLMLVVDTTGSMGDELEYLKQELKNVASRIGDLSRKDLTLRLSTNFYRDTTDEYVVRPFPFSTDSNTVATQLSAQSAGGGGDFPEAVDYALVDAIDEHQWSDTAKARLLFLVLDAPAHQSSEVLNRLRTSVERAAAKGIRIIPVASSGIDKDTEFLLRALSITTGGRYVFLTDDSGIGGGHIEPTVGKYTVEKLNDLMVRVATEYIADAKLNTTVDTTTSNQN